MDIGDVKKLLQVLKGQKMEGKIVDASQTLKDRDLIVNAANNTSITDKRNAEGLKQAEDAWFDKEDPVTKLKGRLKDTVKKQQTKDKMLQFDRLEGNRGVGVEKYNQLTEDTKAKQRSRATQGLRAADMEVFAARQALQNSVVKHAGVLSDNAPVRVANPFKPEETFQFPPGTDQESAKKMVRELLLRRARSGELKIDLPSSLDGEEPPIK